MGGDCCLWCILGVSPWVRLNSSGQAPLLTIESVPLPHAPSFPDILRIRYIVQPCRDVSYETYKASKKGPTPDEAANFSEPVRLGLAATQRATFQSIASMCVSSVVYSITSAKNPMLTCRGLPALTIHTIVAQTKKAFTNVKNPRVKSVHPHAPTSFPSPL